MYDFDLRPVFDLIKWILIITLPFALWQIVETIIWIIKHLRLVVI